MTVRICNTDLVNDLRDLKGFNNNYLLPVLASLNGLLGIHTVVQFCQISPFSVANLFLVESLHKWKWYTSYFSSTQIIINN